MISQWNRKIRLPAAIVLVLLVVHRLLKRQGINRRKYPAISSSDTHDKAPEQALEISNSSSLLDNGLPNPWRNITILFLAACGFVIAAWMLYQMSAQPFPVPAYNGQIEIKINGDDITKFSPSAIIGPGSNDIAINLVGIPKEKKLSDCALFDFTVYGDARFKPESLDGNVVAIKGIDGHQTNIGGSPQRFSVLGCLDGGFYRAAIGGVSQKAMAIKSGYALGVRLPVIITDWKDPQVSRHHKSSDVHTDWIFIHSEPENTKVETASANYTGWEGVGFIWRETGYGGQHPTPFGVWTLISEERKADRALFWAGVLLGGGISIFVWVGELLLERQRRRSPSSKS